MFAFSYSDEVQEEEQENSEINIKENEIPKEEVVESD